jgi:hypothetical protein
MDVIAWREHSEALMRSRRSSPARATGGSRNIGRAQRPKASYTNTAVECWAVGRAAVLIHTSVEGTRDLRPPDKVRIYSLSGTQLADITEMQRVKFVVKGGVVVPNDLSASAPRPHSSLSGLCGRNL